MRGGLLTPYAEAVRLLELDFRQIGELSPEAFSHPRAPIPAEGFAELLRTTARASMRPDLGLLVGDAFRLPMLGPLGLLMREQVTVGEALDAYHRHAGLEGDPLLVKLTTTKDAVLACPLPVGRSRRGDPIVADMVLAGLVKLLSGLAGDPAWRPSAVWLTHREAIDEAAYRRRLGCVVLDAPFDALILSPAALAAPIPGADPEMAGQVERFLADPGAPTIGALSAQVEALIAELLPSGGCGVEQVAWRLGVDRRTIHRRLALEGVSFTSLVERRRRDLLAGPLGRSGRPLTVLAGLLGFSSLAAFSRWRRHVLARPAPERLDATSDPPPAPTLS